MDPSEKGHDLQAGIPEWLARARRHGDRRAVLDDSDVEGGAWTYTELLTAADGIAAGLLRGRASLDGARVALDVLPSRQWLAALWGIWRAGGFAVPLALAFPEPELAYVLDDAEVGAVLADRRQAPRLRALAAARGLEVRVVEDLARDGAEPEGAPALPPIAEADPALLIYTSGTTGKPKGVVLSHGNLQAQTRCLEQAWAWTADDHILEILPLHHVHGIVNVTLSAAWAGASCRFLPAFDAERVWRLLEDDAPTLLMAVPTIYRRLIEVFDAAPLERQARWSAAARRLRLMVSGSAALPQATFERWREISGHALLERYGMSEIGMALGNPLDGERRPATVGQPLPAVELRVVDDAGALVAEGQPGELEIRGPAVFAFYWRRPEATSGAFRDGFFRSGDVAVVEDGYYRLLGRSSVDILKTGGEKVSALEIEDVLRLHPEVRDVAVIGIADPDWGQRVVAVLEGRDGAPVDCAALRLWAKDRLAAYKVPRQWLVVDQLPRNAMGKVQKKDVAVLVEGPP